MRDDSWAPYGAAAGAVAFAADGALGLWVPVIAFASWLALAGVVLAARTSSASEPGDLFRSPG